MANKLELTWVGKNDEIKVEPRILVENPSLSNVSRKGIIGQASIFDKPTDGNFDNMLIHGDNLLALKALESKFAGQIKCIYIDPPYNTGSAFEHYDDNLEHSTWLSLMRPRLELLRNLLSVDGCIFISIDDDERDYLKILCDEIFLRKNFVGTLVWERKKKPSFLSNIGVVTEYILIYAKKKEMLKPLTYGETTKGKKYPFNNAGNGIKDLYFPAKTVVFRMSDGIVKAQNMSEGNIVTELLNDVIIKDGQNENGFTLRGEWRYSQQKLDDIIKNKEEIVISKIPFRPNHIKSGGEPKKMKNLLSVAHYNMATNEDATDESRLLFGNIHAFDYPKPEMLLSTIINSCTDLGDLVLDSFLGSGTTAAVAHKMGRRWIGIEMGDHAYTHCKVRLDKVIEGSDQGGITKAVNWKSGGGYRFYELAPTLVVEDKFGNPVINKAYNADMLAAAMALQEGFSYAPDDTYYWKQGKNENAYIFTTTSHVTAEYLASIHTEMQEDEYLVIACKTYDAGIEKLYNNITVKKIPQVLLGRCEFGKDDYSLNIINTPTPEEDDE